MNGPNHSPATTPSRVVAVSTLQALGACFRPDDTIPEGTLAEVRPHSPRGMLPVISDDSPLFYAEAETETHIFRAVFPAPLRWFNNQIPMSILLNIPDDPSGIVLTSTPHVSGSGADIARGDDLVQRWSQNRTPRVATLKYFDKMCRQFPEAISKTLRAKKLLESTSGRIRNDDDLEIIVTALFDVTDIIKGVTGRNDEAA